MSKSFKTLSLSLFAIALTTPSFVNALQHKNINSNPLINDAEKELKFNPYMSSFFQNKKINQIAHGVSEATASQQIYATSEGLFVQKSIDSTPIQIKSSLEGDNISDYSFTSVTWSNYVIPHFIVNASNSNSEQKVYNLTFTNKNDFTTAIVTRSASFSPKQDPLPHIYATQTVEVNSYTMGIYTRNDGKVGLVWSNPSKTPVDCQILQAFNDLNLDMQQEQYIKLTADAKNNRLFISTAKQFLLIYNINSDPKNMAVATFSFQDEDTKQPIHLKNIPAATIFNANSDVYLSSDYGFFYISNNDLKNAEQVKDNFIMTNTHGPAIDKNSWLNKMYFDNQSGIWLTTNNGLYFSSVEHSIPECEFHKISNGLENVTNISDIEVNDIGTDDAQVILATDNGVYIGDYKNIDPTPTPTPVLPKKGLSNGAIIGIVAGSVSLVAIGIASTFYFVRKNK